MPSSKQAIADAEIATTPSLAEGQTNFPRSSRLYLSPKCRYVAGLA